jgi:hypothetical protein
MSASSARLGIRSNNRWYNCWYRQVEAVFTVLLLVVALFISRPAAAVDVDYSDCKFCNVFPVLCQHLYLRVATAIASAMAMHVLPQMFSNWNAGREDMRISVQSSPASSNWH